MSDINPPRAGDNREVPQVRTAMGRRAAAIKRTMGAMRLSPEQKERVCAPSP
ncbi:MAG: hypothetical protein ACWGKN_13815 [Desulfoprunum sp.]